MIDVVCAVMFNSEGKVLLARRSQSRNVGEWEFPGGKVISGETFQTAIQREIKEELNLDVVFLKKLKSLIKDDYQLHFVLCDMTGNTQNIQLVEHDEVRFFNVFENPNVELIEKDKSFFDSLKYSDYVPKN